MKQVIQIQSSNTFIFLNNNFDSDFWPFLRHFLKMKEKWAKFSWKHSFLPYHISVADVVAQVNFVLEYSLLRILTNLFVKFSFWVHKYSVFNSLDFRGPLSRGLGPLTWLSHYHCVKTSFWICLFQKLTSSFFFIRRDFLFWKVDRWKQSLSSKENILFLFTFCFGLTLYVICYESRCKNDRKCEKWNLSWKFVKSIYFWYWYFLIWYLTTKTDMYSRMQFCSQCVPLEGAS